jgi:hypothetical protein
LWPEIILIPKENEYLDSSQSCGKLNSARRNVTDEKFSFVGVYCNDLKYVKGC